MKDNQKTKKQLIDELDMLRQKVAAFELENRLANAIYSDAVPLTGKEDDITAHKRTEQALSESEKRIKLNLDSILSLEGDIGTLELGDILDTQVIQSIMDDFFSLTKIGVAILDLQGKILVATGWQDICTQFHRVHPETCKHCVESDTMLSEGVEPGSFKVYRCKNNMWNIATPIMVGEKHFGNLFLGQFLFNDEVPDYEIFRSQARQYGFKEQEYIAALERVPRWSRETVNTVMTFYTKLVHMMSMTSYSNIKLAQTVTERDKLLNSLRESETQYRELFNNISSGVAIYEVRDNGNDFIFKDFNKAGERINGDRKEDVLGKSIFEVRPGIKEFGLLDVFKRVWKTGVPEHFSAQIYQDNRLFGWYENYVYMLPSGEIITAYDNVTENKLAEQALRASEDRFRTLVENIPGAVYRCEPTLPWRVIYFSNEIEVITGYPVKVFLENTILINDITLPEDLDMVIKALETSIAGRQPYTIEYRIRHADGSIRWVYEKGRAVYSERGEPLWLDGVYMEITERKRTEEALREAQKLASIVSLAAGMAHEINSPLQVITGLTERITAQLESNQLDQSKLPRDIANINRLGWRIAHIIRSLLTYVSEMQGQVAPQDFNEIIKDTLLLIEHQLRTWSNVNVLTDLGENLPSISCERNQIVQVLINLLTNARDAMPNGGEISIHTRYDADGKRFALQVSDTGSGIPKNIQKKIFDPFFTTKEVGQGTGLGLSIVFGIIKAHGGEIEVESAPKQGTTFTIYLPKEPIQKPYSEPRVENRGRY